MTDLEILSKFVDRREYRNYIHYKLYKLGYDAVKIDDERVFDGCEVNDNDITVEINKTKCTVQTFLNKGIGEKEVKETAEDMVYEDVPVGIIITNKEFSKEITVFAAKYNITIWGKEFFDDEETSK